MERQVLGAGDIEQIDDLRREWMPLWGKWVCVWGLTLREETRLRNEARRGEQFDAERYAICRFIDSVRDGDQPGACPIFNRKDHYDWLASRSSGAIEKVLEKSVELSSYSPQEAAAVEAFFVPPPGRGSEPE